MEQYDALADWYDRLQQDVNPEEWANFLNKLDLGYGSSSEIGDGENGRRLLLDLGCGTGRLTLAMENLGYDVIGIDNSHTMLQRAREQAEAVGSGALFLQQDITDFELFGTVDLAICILDTVNHLTHLNQLKRFFKLCCNYLNKNCLLIIDLATRHHFEKTLGNNIFFQDLQAQDHQPAITMLWQNRWIPARKLSSSEIIIYAEQQNGLFARFEDLIEERFYDTSRVIELAEAAGLKLEACLGDLSIGPLRKNDERVFLVFRQPNEKLNYNPATAE